MWATLTLMSALSMAPGQAGGLELTNDRVTYGRLGPTRKDSKFLPGDLYFLTFEAEGLQFDAGGNAKYSMQMEVFDKDNKPQLKTRVEPRELGSIQGGGRVTLDAYANIKTDTPAGTYSMKVTVTDRLAKPERTRELTRKFEVAEKGFGIVYVNLAYNLGDKEPLIPSPGLGCVGQVQVLHFGITGFDRDPKNKKQPALKVEMRMLDDAGKPMLAKPAQEGLPKADDPVPEEFSVIPCFFPVALTKTGKYTVELTATDLISKKTATVNYPLVVVDPPK
ncbi:MAG TPA: hypothetical protein VKA46_38245 [Gemmataceae bacterium]|nr:hypothetical protein [Gemmataceae bacterium]